MPTADGQPVYGDPGWDWASIQEYYGIPDSGGKRITDPVDIGYAGEDNQAIYGWERWSDGSVHKMVRHQKKPIQDRRFLDDEGQMALAAMLSVGLGTGYGGGAGASVGAGAGTDAGMVGGTSSIPWGSIAKVGVNTGTGYVRGGDTGAVLGGLGAIGGLNTPTGATVNWQDLADLGTALGGVNAPSPTQRPQPTLSPPISGMNIPGLMAGGGTPNLPTPKLPNLGDYGIGIPGAGLPGFRGLDLSSLAKLAGIFGGWGGANLPNVPPGTTPAPVQTPGWMDQLKGALPDWLTGIPGAIGGGINTVRQGLGGANDLGSNLGLASGLGLLGAGLAQQRETPDLEGLFYGAPAQAKGLFDEQQAAETARRQAAEDQYLGRRTQANQTLEDILGQGTQRAITRGVQTQEEKLNRQGLLGGPSGALNEAIARVSGDVRQSQLPTLTDFANQTETGLQGLRGGALTGDISLGRAGVERQSSLQDQQRGATLRQRIMAAQNKNQQRSDLLTAGGTLTGYGLGGSRGADFGGAAGRTLESVLGGR